MAIKEGDAERTLQLIHQGADLEALDKNGFTALHTAAMSENGSDEIAEILIQHHARLEAQDRNGQTPLHLAAGEGNIRVASALIQSGANK
ncbi:ankyrin repeat domain-containing protein, partial [Sansalvadorimonas verongulae]|uniref:ankyrin repeat domain-containing protein n=1 Tax=Sansalvadorimonas verongulae TaxID=2172824 RepID=UPI0018AD2A3B